MKNKSSEDSDLNRALGAWSIDAEIPPGFRAGVWRRIRLQEERRAGRWLWLGWAIERLSSDVRYAAAIPALAIVFGFLLGFWNQKATAHPDAHFQVAYMDSLDPYMLAERHGGKR